MARPEIKNVSDLKGKRVGITTFGSTSDQVVRIALKKFNLEPNKDVALLSLGAQPEVFAAMQSGAVQVGAFTYPLYAAAAKLGMRELINFGALGVEDITGTVITTRSFIAKERDTRCAFCAPSRAACTAIAPIKNSAKKCWANTARSPTRKRSKEPGRTTRRHYKGLHGRR
jgi:ABC-type nitrate/sulfonate/bicarbonate transport system substrate-binding protein